MYDVIETLKVDLEFNYNKYDENGIILCDEYFFTDETDEYIQKLGDLKEMYTNYRNYLRKEFQNGFIESYDYIVIPAIASFILLFLQFILNIKDRLIK